LLPICENSAGPRKENFQDVDVTNSIHVGDRAGIAVAVACAVHCLAAPLLAASVQLAGVVGSEHTEIAFLASSLLISGATVVASCLRHGARRAVWLAFVPGAGLLLCARLAEGLTRPVEQGLVAVGAGLIITAHGINLIACRCAGKDQSCAAID
jgi:hypothetical protein